MWTMFRSVAARIGLSREEVEAVERADVSTYVQHPLSPEVYIRVRPDPDWTQRMTDAWDGVLMNSRRLPAGTIPIPDGQLLVFDVLSPEQGVGADVVAGDYEVVLTVAHLGAEESGDYEEHISHAFALLRGHDAVALIEPITTKDGTELYVEAFQLAFAGTGVVERLAAEHAGNLLIRLARAAKASDGKWARNVPGVGPMITFTAGEGRGSYPLYRIEDATGKSVGVLVDFLVDNRAD